MNLVGLIITKQYVIHYSGVLVWAEHWQNQAGHPFIGSQPGNGEAQPTEGDDVPIDLGSLWRNTVTGGCGAGIRQSPQQSLRPLT